MYNAKARTGIIEESAIKSHSVQVMNDTFYKKEKIQTYKTTDLNKTKSITLHITQSTFLYIKKKVGC